MSRSPTLEDLKNQLAASATPDPALAHNIKLLDDFEAKLSWYPNRQETGDLLISLHLQKPSQCDCQQPFVNTVDEWLHANHGLFNRAAHELACGHNALFLLRHLLRGNAEGHRLSDFLFPVPDPSWYGS